MAAPTNVSLITETLYTYPELVVCGVGFSILITVAIAGNSLVLAAVARTKRLQNVTNVFVVNLSVCDCLSSLAFIWSLPGMLSKTPGYPIQTQVPCMVTAALVFVSFGCGIYTMANIALNRCILITRPRETYRWLYTPKKIALMVLVSWLVPLLATVIPPLFGMGNLGFDLESRTCSVVDTSPGAAGYKKIQFGVYYPIPLLISIISYIVIWRHVRRHFKHRKEDIALQSSAAHASSSLPSASKLDIDDVIMTNECSTMTKRSSSRRRSRRRNDELTITKNLFLVAIAFVVCFTPVAFMVVAKNQRYQLYAALVLFMSCCINPLIYAVKHPHFSPVLRSMIRCQCSKDQNSTGFSVSSRSNRSA